MTALGRTCVNCKRGAHNGTWWKTRDGKRWLCSLCSDRRIIARKKIRLRLKKLGAAA